MDMSAYQVGPIHDVFYIPGYVTQELEAMLLSNIEQGKGRWVQLSGRKSQYLGGIIKNGVLLQTPLPAWLRTLAARMNQETGCFDGQLPNHVLVNAYAPGEGIMPHEDGPLYYPGVCILSLGHSTVLTMKRKGERDHENQKLAFTSQDLHTVSFYLEPRSLLVFAKEAYTTYLHGIDEVKQDLINGIVVNAQQCGLLAGQMMPRDGMRISLTFRRVLKVKNNILRLGK